MAWHDMLDNVTAYASSEVIVGREAELAALRDALKRTRSAEPSAVLVGGEAGVGKTRLVEEFCRSVDGVAQVLTGHCLELGEEGLPYAPFGAALRELVHRNGPAVLEGREREFARLLPELGPAGDVDARRGQLFELVAALFGRVSADRPLVLVIEDLHWADRSTRDLIGFLVRSARLPHVLLVATYRTDELHRGHPLRPFLAELDRVRGVQRLELDRLDRGGTAEMLTLLLGAEPEPRLVDTITERTQGNPFFIEQFAVTSDPECSDIPDSLRDLLLTRVDTLPDAAQRVLRVAAVGGSRFGHDLLTRVAGIDEGELESALRVAVAAQLIIVDADGGYEFRHALVREAVHDDLLPGEHARLHARYAEAIEADPHLVPMGRAPAEIAHHWHAAHENPKALVSAKLAADAARRRYAYAEQARLLERVLELWEQVPEAAELLATSHLDLLEETALVAIDAGENMRALKLTRAALADLDATAEPLRAARLLVRRAKLLVNSGSSDGAAECRQAYGLLGAAPNSTERVLLLADVAHALADVDDDASASVAQEALSAAAELGDVVSEVSATITFNQVCAGNIPADDGLPTIEAAAERARAARDLPSLARALVNLSDTLFELARYEESAVAAAEGIPYADRVGVNRTTGVFLLANNAEALLALGRWDSADARLAEAARQDPPGTLALPWLRLRARLRLARGHDGAGPLVDRAVGFLGKPFLHPENKLSLLELRIVATLQAGDTAGALAASRAALAEPGLRRRPRYGWPLLAGAAAALEAAGGDDAPLRERLRELTAGMPVRYPADRAYAAQVAAILEGGVERWRAAVAAWRADGQRHQLAIALLGLATAAAGAGDRTAAADALQEAVAVAAALGAVPLTAAADTLARRIGVRAATPSGAEILTPREREVLRLVAEGQSNGGIAQRLYISPKTASVHVSRIIAKLDVQNRVEAAAVAHRLGLLDEGE
jgi:DNA-binding CsgD family transcriptional regulator